MKNPLLKSLKYFISISLSLFLFGGQPLEFGEEKDFFQGYSIPQPVIRIGLGVDLKDIQIISSGGMNIYEVDTNYRLIAEDTDEAFIKGNVEKLTEKFVIQVAQSKEEEDAEIIAQGLKKLIENKVYVRRNTEERLIENYQVLVGDFLTRDDALDFIKKLNQAGIEDTWILQENITEKESKPLWILTEGELESLSDDAVLYFIPSSPQSILTFNNRDYRGIFVLRTSPNGLVLINILNLDDYLRSVVPSELSPYDFREIEAHKAQAVAARTYAIKNLKLNDDLGFDLCDTPKSQFYMGMNAEHPLSNLAVEETKGEVALYNGKLINALYTSTCGGMTENAEEIFGGRPLPYLTSTECNYEKKKSWSLTSENTLIPIYLNETNLSSEIASLQSLGAIPKETDPFFYKERVSYEEALDWIEKVLEIFGEENDQLIMEPTALNFLTFSHLIVNAFGWQERVESLLLESEMDSYLSDFHEMEGDPQESLNFLIQEGILPSLQDLEDPERVLARGELIYYLWKVVEGQWNLNHQGLFKGIESDKIVVEERGRDRKLMFSPRAFLLKRYNGDYSFTPQLYLLGRERIRWLESEGEILLLEVIYPSQSGILDPSSDYHSWDVKRSREELQERINQYYPIGQLMDVVPLKKGVSQRVVELLIAGTESQATVKGFRIRKILGLKETLFIIEREYNDGGRVVNFTFRGKGRGHGVGLCQVGAYGLAREGADYQKILKNYYHGIKIEKIYE